MEGSTPRKTRRLKRDQAVARPQVGRAGATGSQGHKEHLTEGPWAGTESRAPRGQENNDRVQQEDDEQSPRGFRGVVGTKARGLKGDKVREYRPRVNDLFIT